MADALVILTKSNASQALHDHLDAKQSATDKDATPNHPAQRDSRTEKGFQSTPGSPAANQQGETQNTDELVPASRNATANQKDHTPAPKTESASVRHPSAGQSGSMTRPKLHSVSTQPNRSTSPVIDYDEEPFPDTATQSNTDAYFGTTPEVGSGRGDVDGSGPDDAAIDENGLQGTPLGNADHRGVGYENVGHESAESVTAGPSQPPMVIVQRADTRLIIHWNAQAGSINYENGPPVDHPRLQAILCDAQIDIQHCDADGLPTGLLTTAHHSDWRQDRYLAFRDGPCRIPECQGIGKTQAHHIFENRVDRTTSVQHMINLCNRCHQTHHDGIFTITGNPEQTITFTYQDGTTLTSHARPLPVTLKTPKPTPFAKHKPPEEAPDLFAA
jgi:hypothetical protein